MQLLSYCKQLNEIIIMINDFENMISAFEAGLAYAKKYNEQVVSKQDFKINPDFKQIFDKYGDQKQVENKEPLFTTEHGVSIYEGDGFWLVDDNFSKQHLYANQHAIYKSAPYFSKEGNANEFVLMNKPITVTVQQLMDRLHGYFKYAPNACANLKQLSNQK